MTNFMPNLQAQFIDPATGRLTVHGLQVLNSARQAAGADLTALQAEVDVLEVGLARATGWAVYNDTAGAQALATSTPATFSVNAGTWIDSQMPSDVAAFWDSATNTITGREGDAIVVKVQCIFTPSDATASSLEFEVDIGGAVGVVEYQDFSIIKGSGVDHRIAWTFLAYTLDTWEANGGTIKVEADGPGSLTEKRVLIARAHKA